jgi:hypothetical protein
MTDTAAVESTLYEIDCLVGSRFSFPRVGSQGGMKSA